MGEVRAVERLRNARKTLVKKSAEIYTLVAKYYSQSPKTTSCHVVPGVKEVGFEVCDWV